MVADDVAHRERAMDPGRTEKEAEEELLAKVPADGQPVGNVTLRGALKWSEDEYWTVRNRLVDRGVLELGKGKGGSVRRVVKAEAAPKEDEEVAPAVDEYDAEKTLYEPMAKVIHESWAADAGFDSRIVRITAQQGSRVTGGKWSRPDITCLATSAYPYVPGRHFDVITFEIKPPDSIDITCVYEALAHLRSATRAYVLLYVPDNRAKELETQLVEVLAEAKRHGVGVITAEKADDYETWEEIVDPVRAEPDPRRLNDFLAKQFQREELEDFMKWFK